MDLVKSWSAKTSYDDALAFLCTTWAASLYLRNVLARRRTDKLEQLWYQTPQADQLNGCIKETSERNIAKHLNNTKSDVVIFWGSQSGTAQQYAQTLSKDIEQRFDKKTLVADLSDFDAASIIEIPANRFAIFMLATYGEGDPPDNAADFFSWMTDNPRMTARCLQFSILGFGNSNYKYYNRFAVQTDALLRARGASPMTDLVLADDGKAATDETFLEWKMALYRKLVENFGYIEQAKGFSASIRVDIKKTSQTSEPETAAGNEEHVSRLPIVNLRKLVDIEDRVTLHVELDISTIDTMRYQTGDHLVITPENPETEIELLCKAMGLSATDLRQPVVVSSLADKGFSHLTNLRTTTLCNILKHHIEICQLVPRGLMMDLVEFAPTASAQERLAGVARSPEAYTKLRLEKRLTLATILHHFGEGLVWHLPSAFVLEALRPLRPRFYSISSAPNTSPKQISVTLNVNNIHLSCEGETVNGLASNYIMTQGMGRDSMGVGSTSQPISLTSVPTILAQVKRSTFKPPSVAQQPMVMIATGTGIAPFRGFIQQQLRLNQVGVEIGSMMLFFGCRNEHEYLYREELTEAQALLGSKLTIITAYSRAATPKCYVQDAMLQHRSLLAEFILDRNSGMYTCGSTRMAKEVRAAVRTILSEERGFSVEKFAQFESLQVKTKRWQEDVWG